MTIARLAQVLVDMRQEMQAENDRAMLRARPTRRHVWRELGPYTGELWWCWQYQWRGYFACGRCRGIRMAYRRLLEARKESRTHKS